MLASGYLLLGLDSAVVGFAAGPLLERRRSRILLAGACGVADGLGSTIGTLAGRPWSSSGETLPAVLLVLYGLVVLAGAACLRLSAHHSAKAVEPRTLPGLTMGTCLVLPVLLSIDNVIYPAPDVGVGAAIGLAGSSAALMLLGLTVGRLVPRLWDPLADHGMRDLWAGAGFVVAGMIVIVA